MGGCRAVSLHPGLSVERVHVTQLPNEQRLALIAKLNKRVPNIVRECRSSPVLKYMSLLPEEIRELL